jgi:hypothetical protein
MRVYTMKYGFQRVAKGEQPPRRQETAVIIAETENQAFQYWSANQKLSVDALKELGGVVADTHPCSQAGLVYAHGTQLEEKEEETYG